MLKNNSGITITALVFIIIVLLILTSIFIASGIDSLSETKSSRIQTEMHALEEAISVKYSSYLKNSGTVSLPGALASTRWASSEDCISVILSTLSTAEREEHESKIRADVTRDYDTYVRIITAREAKTLGVEPFITENEYVVDYYTTSVYGPIQ